jgi:hypothetical protein
MAHGAFGRRRARRKGELSEGYGNRAMDAGVARAHPERARSHRSRCAGTGQKPYACPGGLVQTPSSFRMWIPGRHAASVCTAFTKSGAETSTSSVSDPESPRTLKKNTGIGIAFIPHTPTIVLGSGLRLQHKPCQYGRRSAKHRYSPLSSTIPLHVSPCFPSFDRRILSLPSKILSHGGPSSRCRVWPQASQKDLPLSWARLTGA